jgi:hypothetical protein
MATPRNNAKLVNGTSLQYDVAIVVMMFIVLTWLELEIFICHGWHRNWHAARRSAACRGAHI